MSAKSTFNCQIRQSLLQRFYSGVGYTSAPQVDRLFEVAEEKGVESRLRDGLSRTKVAAVGPIVAENFRGRQVRVDVCPEQGWQMKNLVIQMKRAFET